MSKHERIAEFARQFEGQGIDPRYAGYFALFNAQKFYEAHDVLEDLWLADRRGANGDFYKGLIQLAGAFVHLQKNRPAPAAAVLKLARANLDKYPALHERLDLAAVLNLINTWLHRLEPVNPAGCLLSDFPAPRINLFQGS
jgi:predicted metal-dependent hydrolase